MLWRNACRETASYTQRPGEVIVEWFDRQAGLLYDVDQVVRDDLFLRQVPDTGKALAPQQFDVPVLLVVAPGAGLELVGVGGESAVKALKRLFTGDLQQFLRRRNRSPRADSSILCSRYCVSRRR